MIHKESWYKEVQGFLAEQDTQGLEEDTWAHPKAPGRYPPYEENHPYSDVKDSSKEEGESGGLESDISLVELRSEYPEIFRSLYSRFRNDPYELHQIIYNKSPVEVAGITVTEGLARQLLEYFNARGVARSGVRTSK